MLNALWAQGKVMVIGRKGNNKQWALTETSLPHWAPTQELTWKQHTKQAAQHSLKALGIAQPRHIRDYFIRKSYTNLEQTLTELEKEGTIHQIKVKDGKKTWRGTWYIHHSDLERLEVLDNWTPRTTLISPFDNLIIDRVRTQQVFGFKYSFELYLKPQKRKYGAYVLPILHGDQLIGRVDPKMDRKTGRLQINGVYMEPGINLTKEDYDAISATIWSLARFLGTDEIILGKKVPKELKP
jgi:uncharacterized protein YcaQ